jgi:DNA-binding IscR family transcriptional regulator
VRVRGEPPEELTLRGDAKPLRDVWIALRTNMQQILESVTIADLAAGQLPEPVRRIVSDPEG